MTIKKVFSFLGTSFAEGDVLEVTVKGKVRLGDNALWLALDASDLGAAGKGNLILLSGDGVTSVSRIEPPLTVGERVTWTRHETASTGDIIVTGELLALFDGWAAVKNVFGGKPHLVDARIIRRAGA